MCLFGRITRRKNYKCNFMSQKQQKRIFFPDPDEGEEAESEVPHQLFNVNKASEAIDTVSHFLLEQPNFVEGLEQLNGIYNINVPDLQNVSLLHLLPEPFFPIKDKVRLSIAFHNKAVLLALNMSLGVIL